MKASDYIVSVLEAHGIETVFGYIGGMVTHLVDSLDANPNVAFVQTYHEQSAAIAAEGYARESGRVGVAFATSGPGATNLITGIADAFFDSVPTLFITGQVNTYEYRGDKPVRQLGFQETPVVELVAPITKYATMVTDAADLGYELAKALALATQGRPGPVLLDIPMNIQRADIDPAQVRAYTEDLPLPVATADEAAAVMALVRAAQRPLVLVGGGCSSPAARAAVAEFLAQTGLPFVTSLMGRGLVDESHQGYLGMIGSYGNRCANLGISRTDLLLVLGSRLDTRQTGARIEGFLPDSQIIQVDVDAGELISHRLPNRRQINATVEGFVPQLTAAADADLVDPHWLAYLAALATTYSQTAEVERFVENKTPYAFLQQLNELLGPDDAVCVDIGQNQMWTAQSIQLRHNQRFFTSGGHAPMGYALPAAVGLAFANPDRSVYSINGDGGFHLGLQSLMLVSQYDLPVKVIVLNNSSLGMITQFQSLYFGGRLAGTTAQGGYLVPDLAALAQAYQVPYLRVCADEVAQPQWREQLQRLRNCVVEVVIDGLTTVSPKLEYDQPIYNPSPALPSAELQAALDTETFGQS